MENLINKYGVRIVEKEGEFYAFLPDGNYLVAESYERLEKILELIYEKEIK